MPGSSRSARWLGALSWIVASVAVLGAGTACSIPTPRLDVGPPSDTGLTEGGIIREDAGVRSDASAVDAGGPDAAVPLCSAACDPLSDGSCLDGERCVLITSEPACSAAFGSLAAGMPCDTADACAPGLACFRAGRTSGGLCSEVCCPGDAMACGTVARCGGDGVLVDGTTTDWGRCVLPRTCDVLAPELSCEAREGCYVVDGAGATECRFAGTAAAGDACVEAEDCSAGLFCGGLGERTCLRICSIAAPRACTSSERCIAQTYSPEGTGICVVGTP